MKYDFTTIMDRSGRDSIAVDVPFEIPEAKEGFDRIPMWVADMNFPTVPTVQKAMTERIQHPRETRCSSIPPLILDLPTR